MFQQCHNEFIDYRWISHFGNTTIAPSPEIAQMLIRRFKKDHEYIKIISYGIKPLIQYDYVLNKQYKQMLGIDDSVKVILSVGHLNKQKDRSTLIEAIRILHSNDQFEKAVCFIVGEGEEYTLLQNLIRKYELEACDKLLPALSNIEALNNIADFCVLLSIHEAAPYVILEAASIREILCSY